MLSLAQIVLLLFVLAITLWVLMRWFGSIAYQQGRKAIRDELAELAKKAEQEQKKTGGAEFKTKEYKI